MSDLLKPQQLHSYQKECVLHQLYHDDSMLWLQMGLGKEQPDSEPVLTPFGWRPIGDLTIGDYVIGADGQPTRVHGVYPQGVKPVVEVTFSDGAVTRCGWDHLWNVSEVGLTFLPRLTPEFTEASYKTLSTKEIFEQGLTLKNGVLKWSIPLVQPVEFEESTEKLMDPYTFGMTISNGASRPDEDVFSFGWEKRIPDQYLRSSPEDRLTLLQGLMDTDGIPERLGGVSYRSIHKQLVDDVTEIVRSLGGVTTVKKPVKDRDLGTVWSVDLKLPETLTPFRLQYKLDRWIRPTKYQPLRNIKSIVEVGQESSRCISVDADDRLYVTRGYVVTHNTPITLTTIVDRMRAGQVQKTLILGPLRVIQAVWAREARKWEHTKHLRFSVIHGVKEKRLRAMFADADIFLCNYENLNWLADQLMHYYISQDKPLPWQMCVYDEVSKMKNSTTKRMAGGKRDVVDRWGSSHEVRFTGWRKIIPHFKYRTGLTGTPASNGYLDLHGQFLAVDGGQRLGEYITTFKDQYFASDYNGWKYTPTDIGKQWIEYQISDITKKMDAADYLDMPAVRVTNMMVDLPAKARKAYEDMEKEMFAALDSGVELEVFSKTSISNKTLQICIAEGTEVLTPTGWKPIEFVRAGDYVWDGVEWVEVERRAFNGRREVVDLDGVHMTPDHRVLTVTGWKPSEEIINGNADPRFNRADVRLPESAPPCRVHGEQREQENYVDGGMRLWKDLCGHRGQFVQPQQTGSEVLRVSSIRGIDSVAGESRNESNPSICHMGKHEISLQEHQRQRLSELWGPGYNGVRRMVRLIRKILGRHGERLPRSLDDRAEGQLQRVLQGELQVGEPQKTIEQQENFTLHEYADGGDDSHTGITSVRDKTSNDIRPAQKRVDGRGGAIATEKKTARVYDLINCGPRHRFTVRGRSGKHLLVHNCNGSPYHGETREYEALHDAKLDALESVLEEAGGSPVLCSYTFKSDAERIMKRFKKYKPVNLTTTKSADTEKVINQWNSGQIKLLVGHPACLHPDTEVLTERDGWLRIVDVDPCDRVFDGIEYVSHDGCMYAGHKETIDVFGITMTPDHKVWINDEWVEGQHVDTSAEGKREAQFLWQTADAGSCDVRPLWRGADDASPEHGEAQQEGQYSLPAVQVSPVDRNSNSPDMVRDEEPCEGCLGQRLRRARYRNVRAMGRVREVLRRHVRRLPGRPDDRASGRESGILEVELHMGDCVRSAGKQAEQQGTGVRRGGDPLSGIGSQIRCQQDDVDHETQPRDDCRRSSSGCTELTIREESQPEERIQAGGTKAHVYDLVNCGPRHRFLVRNSAGEMFIVKNSMGHGIDGLQESGSILVWFGMNWSLELYEQMCGRLARQGQKQSVSIIHILCNDTVDLAVADAINRKADDQEGLKRALERYRDGITTNELEVNFF